MNRFILVLVAVAAAFLMGCPSPTSNPASGGSGTTTAKLSKAVVSNAKAFFLQSGTSAGRSVISRSAARDVASITGGQLMQITQSLQPQVVTFQDASGNPVQVTVNKAMQVGSGKLLVDIVPAGDTESVNFIDLATGAITKLSTAPDNWSNIFSASDHLVYEAGGTIYKTPFSTGTAATVSTSANYWSNDGQTLGTFANGAGSWPSDTVLLEDGAGTVYVLEVQNSQHAMAMAYPATGNPVDFGNQPFVYNFFNMTELLLSQVKPGFDSFTGQFFYLVTSNVSHTMSVKPISFDLAGSTVATVGSATLTAPLSTILQDNLLAQQQNFTHVPWQSLNPNGTFSAWSNGQDIYTFTDTGTPTLHHWYSPSLNVSTVARGQDFGSGAVTNWTYSGGILYSGPTASINQIAELILNGNGSVTPAVLVTGTGTITGWTVVGGVLFWTDTSGTWQATVNTATGTLGPITTYTGSGVQAISQ